MRTRFLWVSVVLACVLVITVIHGQTPPQSQPSSSQTVTVAGCVQKETDVLKRPALAGNLGMSDEYVLIRATLTQGQPGTQPAKPSEPTGTPGSPTDFGKVYRVTGDKEKDLKNHLGHQVEIVGKFKHDEDARRELGAAGTSGKPPETTGELTPGNTPEVTIESIRMISATCGGAAKQ